MNNENLQNGKETQFSSTNQPPNAGRKPSRLKKFIKDFDVSKDDIDAIIKNLVFNLSYDELKKLYKSLDENGHSNLSAGLAALVSGILHDVKRGDVRVVSLLLDRVYGKSAEMLSPNKDTLTAPAFYEGELSG